jgi:hypothetical protein
VDDNTFIHYVNRSMWLSHMYDPYNALSTAYRNISQKRCLKDVDTSPLLLHYKLVKEWLQLGLLTEVSFQPICLCMSIKQSTNRQRWNLPRLPTKHHRHVEMVKNFQVLEQTYFQLLNGGLFSKGSSIGVAFP